MRMRHRLIFFLIGASICTAIHANPKQQVVTNTEKGIWDGSRTISLEEELIIGLEIGEESQMFGYVRALTLDAQNHIYVVDSYEMNISVYNAEGEFIREFGREGQGPGELQTIDGICWCPKDNNLYIVDRRNHRITRFSPEGEPLGEVKDNLFRASIEGISSLEDGRFVLTARTMGDNSTGYKIIVTDFSFENVIAEKTVEFPSHTVGIKWAPKFSDVGIISGDKIYYTSPSAYEIVVLDADLNTTLTVQKSHPRTFIPQYVQGFYADFNTIETLLKLDDIFVVGVASTPIKNIPRFKTKREFLEFTHTPDLREWDLESAYQLDFFNKDFKFLGCVEIPKQRRLVAKDSKNRLYFIEQEPYPRVVRCKIVLRPM
jgi:hypothetical protein